MDLSGFSGVYGVFEGTEAVEAGVAGLADRNFGVQNDPAFSYQTASGTKGFTAAAVLALAAEGRLSLDGSARAVLEGAGGTGRYGALEWLPEAVTVRSLMSHTSGVPDYFDEAEVDDFEGALGGAPVYRFERPEDFFPLAEAAWRRRKDTCAHRGSFRYSNGGFVVLAAVAEAASGLPFPACAGRHVFGPAGMAHSGFYRLDGPAPAGVVRAASYQADGRSNIYAVPVIGGGDGGAYTNPADMARFWTALDPEASPASPAAALLREAWTPVSEGEDGLYGLGFWLDRRDPQVVFLEGFDPGVRFFSRYHRGTKRSYTVCLNDEAARCDEVIAHCEEMIR